MLTFCLLLGTIPFMTCPAPGQHIHKTLSKEVSPGINILFYNLENAFDTIDDPCAGDDEFLPEGARRWNGYRYRQKLNSLYKVLVAAGGWDAPDVIGVCEVEKRRVLEDLVHRTPFSRYPYRIIHQDSPDARGTDVAALYHAKHFFPLCHDYIPLQREGSTLSTREILYIKGLVRSKKDTLHLFFNHWPSKWQGALATRPKRILAARTLREKIDSIRRLHPRAFIAAMGDFNDPPQAESLTRHLGAEEFTGTARLDKLYNLSFPWQQQVGGTQKYRENWQVIDQVMVSGTLLKDKPKGKRYDAKSQELHRYTGKGLHTTPNLARIIRFPFLLTSDKQYTGTKPFRTWLGYRYQGGFSDHLPVMLEIRFKP